MPGTGIVCANGGACACARVIGRTGRGGHTLPRGRGSLRRSPMPLKFPRNTPIGSIEGKSVIGAMVPFWHGWARYAEWRGVGWCSLYTWCSCIRERGVFGERAKKDTKWGLTGNGEFGIMTGEMMIKAQSEREQALNGSSVCARSSQPRGASILNARLVSVCLLRGLAE